jgi:hypothetical protein
VHVIRVLFFDHQYPLEHCACPRIPLTKVVNQLAMVIDSDSFGDELALTAFARMEDRREAALAAGFQDHLVKPVKAQVLRRIRIVNTFECQTPTNPTLPNLIIVDGITAVARCARAIQRSPSRRAES